MVYCARPHTRYLLALMLLGSLFGKQALAMFPESLHLRCKSRQIGIFEMKMTHPAQGKLPDDLRDYDMEVSRFDLAGKLLSSDKYTSDMPGDEFMALYAANENAISLRIPAGSVDWKKHADDCYLDADAPGLEISLNYKNGALSTSKGDLPVLDRVARNPNLKKRLDIGFPPKINFYVGQKKCAGEPPPAKQTSKDIPVTCVLLKNKDVVAPVAGGEDAEEGALPPDSGQGESNGVSQVDSAK